MHPRQLERKLKKLNPRLNVRRYWNKQGLNDGVYYGNKVICAIHSGYIWPARIPEHHNLFGIPHRSLLELFDIIYREGYIKYRDRWKFIN